MANTQQKIHGFISFQLLLGIVLLVLLCSISLLFVLFNVLQKDTRVPTFVMLSNVSRHEGTVSFVTKDATQLCVVAYTIVPPWIRMSCDKTARRVHTITLTGLLSNASHRLLIGHGFLWTRGSIDPVGGILQDASYTKQPLPRINTLSKDIVISQNASILLGTVNTPTGNSTPNALVIVKDMSNGNTFSTRTNSTGKFALSVPSDSSRDTTVDIQCSVFDESGYLISVIPLDLVANQIQTLTLTPYQ